MSSTKNNNNHAHDRNNNKKAVLDSSALLALFSGEISAEKAAEMLDSSCVSSVTLAEVLSQFQEEGGDAARVLAQLQRLNLDIRPFDLAQLQEAIQILNHQGENKISLGDRAAMALSTKI